MSTKEQSVEFVQGGIYTQTGHWFPAGEYLPAAPKRTATSTLAPVRPKQLDTSRGLQLQTRRESFPSEQLVTIAIGRLLGRPIDTCKIMRNKHGRPYHVGKVILVEFIPVGKPDPILPIIYDWRTIRDDKFSGAFATLTSLIIGFVEQYPVAQNCPDYRATEFYKQGMLLVRSITEAADELNVLTRPERSKFCKWLLAAVTQPYKFTRTKQPAPTPLPVSPSAARLAHPIGSIEQDEEVVGWLAAYESGDL